VSFREDIFAKLNASDDQIEEDEVSRYLNEVRVDPTTDVLQWWKSNAHRYPVLSKMARDVLAMPASSVASEAAFSASGRVITDYRARLNPKTVSVLLELESWMKATIRYGWKAPAWTIAKEDEGDGMIEFDDDEAHPSR
jgi:hypothetical protein